MTKMRSFSDELYHYGVKGMKWGVITKKDEPKNPKSRAKGDSSKTPTDDGGTAYLKVKRSKGEIPGKPGSYLYRDEKAKQMKSTLTKYNDKVEVNGKKASLLGSNGLPNNKDDAHFLAFTMATESLQEQYGSGWKNIPRETRKIMLEKQIEEIEGEILDAMEWENKDKPKALKKYAKQGRDKTNDLITKFKNLPAVKAVTKAARKGARAVSKFLNKLHPTNKTTVTTIVY